jgi:hypothetical protein
MCGGTFEFIRYRFGPLGVFAPATTVLQDVHNATDDAAIIGSFETEYFRPQVRFVKSCFRSRQTGVPSRAKSLY